MTKYERLAHLFDKLRTELMNHKECIPYDSYVKDVQRIQDSITNFAELEFENAAFELIHHGYKFTLIFPVNQTVMVTKSLDPDSSFSYDDVIFTMFDGDELLAANMNNEKDFIQGLKKYFISNDQSSNYRSIK